MIGLDEPLHRPNTFSFKEHQGSIMRLSTVRPKMPLKYLKDVTGLRWHQILGIMNRLQTRKTSLKTLKT